MAIENHWSNFGDAPSIKAGELNASNLGKDIAVIIGGSSALIGPLTKLAFKSGSEWGGVVPAVKITVGYDKDGSSFKVVLDGTHDVHLLEAPVCPEAEVPA